MPNSMLRWQIRPNAQAPRWWSVVGVLVLVLGGVGDGLAQEPAAPQENAPQAPERVEVQGVSSDEQIAARLQDILVATEWFENPQVSVRDGVVFLAATTGRKEYRDWAGELARKTADVAAVVNRIQVAERSPWDFSPALDQLRILRDQALARLPVFAVALLLLLVFIALARLAVRLLRELMVRRDTRPLLRDVLAWAVALPVVLFGVYLALQVAGLGRLAVSLIGGTGLAGLVVGFAVRDIVENFFAGFLISLRNPFRTGDLIEVEGHLGVVQRVTSRGTVLMDHDGNHVQIPNATVYKSTILNFTANPRRRMNFAVGIGYESAISRAQELAMAVLRAHPAVLDDPEALVLVEQLASATVNLRIYFWYDSRAYDGLKIRSSLMRLVKRSFEENRISMPDDAREVIFPQGVPVHMLEEPAARGGESAPAAAPAAEPEISIATAAEGDLRSEEETIQEQGRSSRSPEEGADLLKP